MLTTMLALLSSLATQDATTGNCSALATTQPAEENRTILLQSYGTPQPMVVANTIDRVSAPNYRQMEVVAPDAETAMRASQAEQFTFYTIWAARGLLKRETRDGSGRVVAAFSYPEDQIMALMQAEPGSHLVVDRQNLMTRTQSRIAVHFVGCQWLEIDAGRFFTRVYEKSEPFDGTPPGARRRSHLYGRGNWAYCP